MKNWSHSLRRSFVKDYSLPISVVQDPYFEHQILALNRQYETLCKVDMLGEALARFGNEGDFLAYMKATRESIIDSVKDHSKYQDFVTDEDHAIHQTSLNRKVPDKCVYKHDNVGKQMVSVDLVSANFQTFRMTFPELVQNCDSYDEFVSNFTDLEYFKKSKKIRQIIFGNLSPKKQQTITKKIMWAVWGHLTVHNANYDLSMISSDELILRQSDHLIPMPVQDMRKILENCNVNGYEIKTRVQDFVIEPIKMKSSCAFVKRYPDGNFDLKCCQGSYTLEVLRHLWGQEVHPYDRVFYHDGRVCEFKDPLFE